MPSSLPEKKPDSGDAAWLFTRVILFVVAHYVSIIVGVVTAVTMGGVAFTATNSKFIGMASGLGVYLACMGGKAWLIEGLALRLFSGKDVSTMDKVIDGKK